MPAYLPDFFITPRQIAYDPKIKPVVEKVYAVIYWFSQMRLQKCVLSNEAIAEIVQCSESAARKGIYQLIEHGYVEAVYADEKKEKRLELIPLVVMGGGTVGTGGVSPQGQGGVPTGTHNKNIKREVSTNNIGSEHPIILKEEKEPVNQALISSLAAESRSERGVQEAAEEIIEHFNLVYGTGYKPKSKGYHDGIAYWLDVYTVDEIKQSITNAQYDQYWAPIFKKGGQALELLLRKEKAKKGGGSVEKVDRIGQFLNVKTPVKIRPLTEMEFYEVAKKLNVPADHTKKRYDDLMDMVNKGSFDNRDDEETVAPALIRWVESEKTKGYVSECNEIDLLQLENWHPKNILAKKFNKKRREFEDLREEFKTTQGKLDNAPDSEKEAIKSKLRELAPIGKKVQAEYEELKAEMLKMREVYGTE